MNYDYFNDIPLSEVSARMVSDCGRPLKAIAADIGKGYSTLYRELDLEDEGGKIGVDTLLPLIRACIEQPFKCHPPPLLWLNSKCGFRAVPIQAEPGFANVLEESLEDLQALARFQEGIRKRLSPEKIALLARAVLY